MTPDLSTDLTDGDGRFHTTRWSVILSSLEGASDEARVREALGRLCRVYWRPVFAFVCRRGHSVPDAQDLTQDFFLMVLKGNFLQQADRQRGRFRSFLLTSLQNFLHDAHDKATAQARPRPAVCLLGRLDGGSAFALRGAPKLGGELVGREDF